MMKLSRKIIAAIIVVIIVGTIGGLSVYNLSSGNIPSNVSALNPKLEQFYQRVPIFLPDQGFLWVAEGPHVSVLTYQNQVIGTQIAFPAEDVGWYPWFDQPEGQPVDLPPGRMYTQTVYYTDRPSFAHFLLGLPLSPPTLDFERIKELNPKVAQFYQAASPPVPTMGVHHVGFEAGAPGLSIILCVWEGEVICSEMALPVDESFEPWFPWFDTEKGEVFVLPGVGTFYLQHIFLKDAASPQEIAAVLPPPPPLPSVPPAAAGVTQQVIGIMEWGFNQRAGGPNLVLQAGERVEIVVINQGDEPHDFVVPELGLQSKLLAPGEMQTLEFVAQQTGEFDYFCSVPGHKDAGMFGTITIV